MNNNIFNNRRVKDSFITVAAVCLALFCSACNNNIIREGTATADSDLECRAVLAKGTRVNRSLCLTEDKWAELDARAQTLADQQERDADVFFQRSLQKSGLGLGSSAPEDPRTR